MRQQTQLDSKSHFAGPSLQGLASADRRDAPVATGRDEPNPTSAGAPRLWVISELYYPESTSTGRFLTGIAEGLSQQYDVHSLCSQPTYSARGLLAPRQETRNGVRILRCRSTLLDKNIIIFRLLNVLTLSVSMVIKSLTKFRSGDLVLVVTNPPLMPHLMNFVCTLRRARMVLLVHDVYPELLVATGTIRPDGVLKRVIERANGLLYRRVERIVALGRDMRDLILRRDKGLGVKMRLIPNWGDTNVIVPRPRRSVALLDRLGLRQKFVVQYLGNMGRTHALDLLLDVAAELSADTDIHFIFCGEGARRHRVELRIERESPANVTLLPPCSEDELPEHLAACDLAVISFIPGMCGISVPSRMYNVLAAGRPILAVADADSELCQMIEEERVGWTVAATESAATIASFIREAAADRQSCEQMGARARRAAESRYSRDHVVASFKNLFRELAMERVAR